MNNRPTPAKNIIKDFYLKLGYTTFSFITTAGITYYNKKVILFKILEPLKEIFKQKTGEKALLLFMHPAEAFFSYLSLTLTATFVVTVPVIYLYGYLFVISGIHKTTAVKFKKFLKNSLGSAFFGIFLTTKYLIPLTLYFFISFEVNEEVNFLINYQPRVKELIALEITAIWAIIFISAVISYLYTRELNKEKLKNFRKYIIIVALITAAVITPPDVNSQIFTALFAFAITEILIIRGEINFIIGRGRIRTYDGVHQ